MSDSAGDKEAIPGYEGDYIVVGDEDGDAYYDEKEKMPAGVMIVVIFIVGIFLAAIPFYILYRWSKCKRENSKSNDDSRLITGDDNGPVQAMGSFETVASNQSAGDHIIEMRLEEIERCLIVQTWMADIHPSHEEAKEDEESPCTTTNHNHDESIHPTNACRICNQPFETGEEVVRSPNSEACRHFFHKKCMLNWLQYQTECPICHQPYLPLKPLETVP